MSLKCAAMRGALPQPQVQSNYHIIIPGVTQALLRCHSASLPFDERSSYAINVSGENVYVPGKSNASGGGSWECRIYESTLMDMGMTIDALKTMEISESQGCITSINYHDIYIMLCNNKGIPTYGKILRNAFLKSVSPVQLSADGAGNVVEYSLTFQYSFCDKLLTIS